MGNWCGVEPHIGDITVVLASPERMILPENPGAALVVPIHRARTALQGRWLPSRLIPHRYRA